MTALVDLFTELCAIPSPSGQERAVADRVLVELRALGLDVDEDATGPVVGSDTGNLLARVPPTKGDGEGGTPIFLCAHLDTVPPTGPIEPAVEDGVIRNAAGTILGADNKSAVVVMVEAVRRIVREGRSHAGVELLLTTAEETGLKGAFAFDHTRLRSRVGYVFDEAAPIGRVIVGAPSACTVDLHFRGRSAHSGMAPEEGRSAIAAAARAVADFRLGRVDEATTANVGGIRGGTARNVIPDSCMVEAEVRSHDERALADLVQEMLETAAYSASLGGCVLESELNPSHSGYRFRPHDEPVRIAVEGLRRAGRDVEFRLSGAATDANVFNARGLACVNLADGSVATHTPDEHIAVGDLEAMVEVTLGIVDAASDAT